jgi:site-specific DNA-methyltransferase (adenine-specific)
MSTVTLYRGKCEDNFKYIPDNSIDLILCDPPYGTTACSWDTVIDFDFMWQEIKRVRKDKSAIVLFGSEPFSSALRMSNIKEYKYDWVWVKNRASGHLNAKIMPLKLQENISVFGENLINYYPILEEYSDASKKRFKPNDIWKAPKKKEKDSVYSDFKQEDYTFINENGRCPYNVLFYKTCAIQNKEKIHPTQKPVELIKYLIKTYSLEGQTVLDFTMGSGTTGVGCVELNRNFIGIETDYFDVAEKRIREAQELKKYGYINPSEEAVEKIKKSLF